VQFIHSILHRALKQALRWGLVARNVADLVDAPTVKRKALEMLTVDQVKILLDTVQYDRLYSLYVLAVTTGMREGELLGLHWEDIDFLMGTIQVRRTVQSLKGKGLVFAEPKSDQSRRQIAVPQFALDALKAYQNKTGNASGLVYRTCNGTPICPRNFIRHFKSALKKANLPDVRFHSCRHFTATALLASGTHPKVVQELLGHSQISLTLDTYSHVIPSLQYEAAEKMDHLFSNVVQQKG
jgi:integrase